MATASVMKERSSLVEPNSIESDNVAFNPKSILPTTKSRKNLSHFKSRSLAYTEDTVASDRPRIDGCVLEHRQPECLQSDGLSASKDGRPPFVAFGIKAYPTRAIFNDICYDFVRTGRWCRNGAHCSRIHPVRKSEYLHTVIRESNLFELMRAGKAVTPSGTTTKRKIEVPSSNATSSKATSTNARSSNPTSSNPTSSNPTSSNPTSSNPTSSNPTSSNPTSSNPTSSDCKVATSPSPSLIQVKVPEATQASQPRDHVQFDTKYSRPKPKSTERCRKWLRGQCEKGDSCHYMHEDLDYDSDSQDASRNKTTIVVLRRGPETMSRTLHRHIRATFGSGFCVSELSTGFESFCVIIGGLVDTSDSEILELVKPFGKVRELRRPIDRTSQMTIRVYFEKTSEAFAALVALHGSVFLGRMLDVKPGSGMNGSRLLFKGNAVRFEWPAPCRTVYMGYANRLLAEQAIDDARLKPYGDFMTAANIHIGIPAVGAITVKFRYLPLDVDQDRMKIFGPHQGMVTGKPNVDCTTQDLIRAFKHMLKSKKAQITVMDVRGPPYTNGKMKAWVTFANARDAQDAAANFHLSKDFMGGMAISAFHVKSISFTLTPLKYQLVAAEIRALQSKLFKEDNGYWFNISERKEFVSIQFWGDDLKVLARLKAEFERILNGEQLYDKGKVVWDPYLAGLEGRAFLDKLQQEFPGVIIVASPERRIIRLLGDAEKRALVRKRIISFVGAQQARATYSLPLGLEVFKAFEKDGFSALETQLGQGNIILDSWRNTLVVSGNLDAYTLAKDAVFAFRLKHRFIAPHWKGETCPACTGLASSPVKLPCGHSWCRSCLRHYLKSSMDRESLFPLSCHGFGKGCGEPIPLFTAGQILTPDDFETLFQAAFTAHVLTHPSELHYCPTPDCSQIYRSTPEGIFMQCPECLLSICTHCHSEAHEGLTCTELHDGDGLFREWAAANNVKQCPKCKMAIEKAEGCNHMTCRMCQTHICWVCLETFEDGLKIYGHMQAKHGGSGL